MKRLSILLIVSLLILTGCQTVPQSEPLEIPPFSVPAPVRPILDPIPSGSSGAIKALTMNMATLVGTVKKWEAYNDFKDSYYEVVFKIIREEAISHE